MFSSYSVFHRGVVQLFNAVREQQKDIGTKLKQANGSVRKEEKVLRSLDKRAFLDVLMGNAQSERVEDHVRTKTETVSNCCSFPVTSCCI